MNYTREYKLDILSLIELRNDITFADIDRVVNDVPKGHVEHSFLYSHLNREKMLWVFHSEDLLNAINELLQAEAIEYIETSSLEYAKNLTEPAIEKFSFILYCDNWVPTVLKKGKNFEEERERLLYDTSR